MIGNRPNAPKSLAVYEYHRRGDAKAVALERRAREADE
jgi:hypothetical protein